MSSDNLDDIIRIIRESVGDVMRSDVTEEAKKVVSKHVKSDVYSYKPKTYTRRGEFGKESNVQVDVKGKGNGFEMEIENTTKGREGFAYLDEVTEYGTGGNWNETPPARPFMGNSSKELDNKTSEALKKGLKARGLDVE